MAKKDGELREDIDRGPTEEQGKGTNERNSEHQGDGSTTIKNASASGLGAMERNDQQPGGSGSESPGE